MIRGADFSTGHWLKNYPVTFAVLARHMFSRILIGEGAS